MQYFFRDPFRASDNGHLEIFTIQIDDNNEIEFLTIGAKKSFRDFHSCSNVIV